MVAVVWVQARLIQSEAPIVLDDGHDFEGERCDIKCLKAAHERCRCRCGGKNHGLLNKRVNSTLDGPGLYFSLDHDPEIRRLFDGKRCMNCGEPLDFAPIMAYEHGYGLYYEAFRTRLWIFAECIRCGYQNALNEVARW
ncbi:MAG: hypothetical protein QW794_05435 [Thermosphaera sp.]